MILRLLQQLIRILTHLSKVSWGDRTRRLYRRIICSGILVLRLIKSRFGSMGCLRLGSLGPDGDQKKSPQDSCRAQSPKLSENNKLSRQSSPENVIGTSPSAALFSSNGQPTHPKSDTVTLAEATFQPSLFPPERPRHNTPRLPSFQPPPNTRVRNTTHLSTHRFQSEYPPIPEQSHVVELAPSLPPMVEPTVLLEHFKDPSGYIRALAPEGVGRYSRKIFVYVLSHFFPYYVRLKVLKSTKDKRDTVLEPLTTRFEP